MASCSFATKSSLLNPSFRVLLVCIRCDTYGTSSTFLISRCPSVNSVPCWLFSALLTDLHLLSARSPQWLSDMVMVTGSLLEAQRSPCYLVPYHPLGVLFATRYSLGHSARPPLSALHHPDYSTPPLWGFSTPSYSQSLSDLLSALAR